MPNLHDLAASFRTAYLRELFHRLALQFPAPGSSIAMYGAGRHTSTLLELLRGSGARPNVTMILDDSAGNPSSTVPASIAGIPVCHPSQVNPATLACVIISSDTVESAIADRARAWISPNTLLVTPYANLPRGPYPQPALGGSAFFNTWGNNTQSTRDHLPIAPDEPILRLASTQDPNLAHAPDGLPLPPPGLRAGYDLNEDSRYLARGKADAVIIREMIAAHTDFSSCKRILDWGCCTGRILRHFADIAATPGARVMGADVCAQSIEWNQRHLTPPFSFVTTTLRPHLPFCDGEFDLVYNCSVFTHIRELWDSWLMELRRIIRPGGFLWTSILEIDGTTKPSQQFRDLARSPTSNNTPDFDFSQPLTGDMIAAGSSYDPVVYWSRAGIDRRWSPFFEVLDFRPGVQNQTAVLLRRRKI